MFGDWREDEIQGEMDDPLHAELDRAVELFGDAIAGPVFGDWREDESQVEGDFPLHAELDRAEELWDDALAVIERPLDLNENTKKPGSLGTKHARGNRTDI